MLVRKSRLIVYIFSLLIILILTACNSSADAANTGTYSVDPTFSDFYKELGGEAILGPAMSPTFKSREVTYQYVVSGLMAYDPNQVTLTRFHFSPVASTEWGINDLVEPTPSDIDIPYLNGHRIWEEVLPFYNRFGPEIIGLPITGVKANDEMQRYEQYFEGLGFYRSYADPPGKIQLLPYGSWMCGNNCKYHESNEGKPSNSYSRNYSETEQLFLQEAERLGYEFTGNPLASPTLAPDGNFEMVFENIAMYIDPSDGSKIKLRPLPSLLGIHSDPPTKEIKADWLSFYQQGEGLGYNIPDSFSSYIADHGGVAYAGVPITEYFLSSDEGYSQCFTNLCLEYHPKAPKQLLIRPHALGIDYNTNGITLTGTVTPFDNAIQLNVWEKYPLIPSGERQIINIAAIQNDAPMSNVKLSLLVTQPEGIVKSYQLNPTGDGGETSIELDPINGPNGTIIQYEVCVVDAITPQICFLRSYTIWNQ
jgi:hypothetical protein